MAEGSRKRALTGHDEFDSLIAAFADERDSDVAETVRQDIWQRFGVEGTVFISDMASFSSTSRKLGVCHFLKLIYRAREIIAPIIRANNGTLLKFDADNCYAFFTSTDDAIKASFEVNAALLSRCRVFVLESLSDEALIAVLLSALADETHPVEDPVGLDRRQRE